MNNDTSTQQQADPMAWTDIASAVAAVCSAVFALAGLGALWYAYKQLSMSRDNDWARTFQQAKARLQSGTMESIFVRITNSQFCILSKDEPSQTIAGRRDIPLPRAYIEFSGTAFRKIPFSVAEMRKGLLERSEPDSNTDHPSSTSVEANGTVGITINLPPSVVEGLEPTRYHDVNAMVASAKWYLYSDAAHHFLEFVEEQLMAVSQAQIHPKEILPLLDRTMKDGIENTRDKDRVSMLASFALFYGYSKAVKYAVDKEFVTKEDLNLIKKLWCETMKWAEEAEFNTKLYEMLKEDVKIPKIGTYCPISCRKLTREVTGSGSQVPVSPSLSSSSSGGAAATAT